MNESLANGLTILVGSNGCGKTIFAQQYAFEILQGGGKVLWLTTEELPSTLRDEMKRFGWDVTRYEIEKKFVMIDAVSPARLGLSESLGHGMIGMDPTGMLIAITDHLRNTQPEIEGSESFLLVLDSVSRLLLTSEHKVVVDFVSCINSRMENSRVKGIATASEDVHDERLLNSLIYSCAGTIRFRIREEDEKRIRQLRIETMRGRHHDESWKNYEIDKSGINIEI